MFPLWPTTAGRNGVVAPVVEQGEIPNPYQVLPVPDKALERGGMGANEKG